MFLSFLNEMMISVQSSFLCNRLCGQSASLNFLCQDIFLSDRSLLCIFKNSSQIMTLCIEAYPTSLFGFASTSVKKRNTILYHFLFIVVARLITGVIRAFLKNPQRVGFFFRLGSYEKKKEKSHPLLFLIQKSCFLLLTKEGKVDGFFRMASAESCEKKPHPPRVFPKHFGS